MEEEVFLLKYAKVKVVFWSFWNGRMIYGNRKKGIVVSAQVEYADSLTSIETVNDIFKLKDFQFSIG